MENKTIYGVFNGCYSDWDCLGYFDKKEDAERYCLGENKGEINSYLDCYVMEIKNLQMPKEYNDLKIYKCHEILFDYDINTGKYTMRDEPDRYDIMSEVRCHKVIKICPYARRKTSWISFNYVCEDRKKAEKVAQDLMAIIMNEYVQSKDMHKALELIEDWKVII